MLSVESSALHNREDESHGTSRDRRSRPVGSALARPIARRGEKVRVVTRSGSGRVDGTERVAADAADAEPLAAAAAGADAIYNCVNPPYHRWAQDWPPIAAALLAAAEATGAVLATTGEPLRLRRGRARR